MKYFLSALLCSFMLLACATVHAASTPVRAAVTASPAQQAAMQLELDRLIAQFSDGIAETYSENPARIVYGNLFGDHQHDAVVLFNLEGYGGGNHHAEFIAFFTEQEQFDVADMHTRPYLLVAVTKLGERGWRSFDFNSASIKQKSVTLNGKEMTSGDAMCCPSLTITRSFGVDEFDHIIESKDGKMKRRAARP
ncbi:hypothetical protein [Undibacterium sp. YM2]|uniref:hypothetical protein n=1 Tax=Undibacterium sp. YM2 TaxID=2058625 RepID=UPI001389CF84|nr:hypothetical protein [Undibacterium sp. YM2]